MKRLVYIVAVAALFLSGPRVLAKAAHLPLRQKVSESNLIARIKVLSITKNTAKDNSRFRYRSIAKVEVSGAVKGAQKGKIFDLEFDNGLGCPNVLYSKDDDCLIFASRLPNARYATYNTYFGNFDIVRNKISWWPEAKEHSTSYTAVVAQIKRQMHNPNFVKAIKSCLYGRYS